MHKKKGEVIEMTEEAPILKVAREIYDFVEEKYADKDLSTRDIRLARAIVVVDQYSDFIISVFAHSLFWR